MVIEGPVVVYDTYDEYTALVGMKVIECFPGVSVGSYEWGYVTMRITIEQLEPPRKEGE